MLLGFSVRAPGHTHFTRRGVRGCPLPSGDERLSGVPVGRSQSGLTSYARQLLFGSGCAQPEPQPLLHYSQVPTWTQTWALAHGLTSQLDLAFASYWQPPGCSAPCLEQWDGPWLGTPWAAGPMGIPSFSFQVLSTLSTHGATSSHDAPTDWRTDFYTAYVEQNILHIYSELVQALPSSSPLRCSISKWKQGVFLCFLHIFLISAYTKPKIFTKRAFRYFYTTERLLGHCYSSKWSQLKETWLVF